MPLPKPDLDAIPFTPLTAQFLDDMIENIESLSDGSGFEDGAITTGSIADGAITGNKVGSGAIGTSNIADNAVNTSKIANNAVTTAKIANNNVTTAKIATSAVTSNELNMACARATKTATQTISNTTGTRATVTLNSMQLNNPSGTYTLSSNSITVPAAGVYLIAAEVRIRSNRNFWALINAGGSYVSQLSFRSTSGSAADGYQSSTGTAIVSLSAGAAVYLQYENRDIATTIDDAYLNIVRLA